MNQSRETHRSARPLHSPEGGLSWTDAGEQGRVGYATGARRDSRTD
jgi:hypothetical protein